MKRKKRDPVSREPFRDVLRAIRSRQGWKMNALASAMGVTPRTLVRWFHHRAMPGSTRRVAVVVALRDLPPDLVVRLASSLDVDARVAGVAPPASQGPIPEHAHATLDAALYVAADALNVRAGDLRVALAPILAAIEDLGISPLAARGLLERDQARQGQRAARR